VIDKLRADLAAKSEGDAARGKELSGLRTELAAKGEGDAAREEMSGLRAEVEQLKLASAEDAKRIQELYDGNIPGRS